MSDTFVVEILQTPESVVVEAPSSPPPAVVEVGIPGPPGPISPSSSAIQITKIASVNILRGEALVAVNETHVDLADATQTLNSAMVLGLAAHDAQSGENVDVVIMGVLSDNAFSVFSTNKPIFLDEQGGVTDEKRIDGFHVTLGKSLGGQDILVNIQQPIQLGS